MSYFGRIASRGSGAPGAGPLAQPALRSASPLAEYDQRFHVTSESGEAALDTSALSVAPHDGKAALTADETPGLGADAAPLRARSAPEPVSRFRTSGMSHAATAAAAGEVEPARSFHAPDPSARPRPALDLGPLVVGETAGSDRVELSGTPPAVPALEPAPSPSLVTPVSVLSAGAETSKEPAARNLTARGKHEALQPAESASVSQSGRATAPELEARGPERARKPAEAEPSNQLSALAAALSKVEAWMRQPSPQTAASAEPAPAVRVSEHRAPRSVPKLVIGHVEVEVIAPKEPPPRPARRPRAAPAAAAPGPAPSVLAKQNFGARQR